MVVGPHALTLERTVEPYGLVARAGADQLAAIGSRHGARSRAAVGGQHAAEARRRRALPRLDHLRPDAREQRQLVADL